MKPNPQYPDHSIMFHFRIFIHVIWHPIIQTTHLAVSLLLSERSQAEMNLTERSIMTKKRSKMWQYVLPAWFYQTAASLGKTQELNRKPYNKQSAWAVHPQGFSGKIQAGMLRKECCISSAWTANYCCLHILPESSGFAASLMQFMQFIPPPHLRVSGAGPAL